MSDREILPTEAVIIHDELLNELIEIFHARGFNHRMPEDAVVRKRDQRTYHALRELRRTRGLQRLRIAPEPSVEQRKPDGYAFRYPDGFIRFSGGTRYNGDEPTETIPYYFGSPAPEPAGKCGTCGESIKPDRLTGTTCACVTRMRDCICSDPENCREPVPGRRCKAGLSANGAPKHE